MLHVDSSKEALLNIVTAQRDNHAAVAADPGIVENIDQHWPALMILAE